MIKKFLIEKGFIKPKYKLVMSKKEQQCFKANIEQSKYYLEFGAGGSTLCALHTSKARVFSIESSKEWVEQIYNLDSTKIMIKNNRLNLYYIDIGPTRKWGFPKGIENRNKFPNYSSWIFNKIECKNIDTVFIDGRFRVACTLSVILHCEGNANLKIIIHDFWNRPHYHRLLNYLEVTQKVESMAVCKIKRNLDMESVKRDYSEFKFNPK